MINSKKKAREFSSFDFSSWTKNKPEIDTYTFKQKKKKNDKSTNQRMLFYGW